VIRHTADFNKRLERKVAEHFSLFDL